MSPTGTGPAPYGGLAADMRSLHHESFTGALLVFGPPDTTLHFRQGLLVAARTPAAPAPDTLLLRSGAVPEQDWAAARAHALTTGDLGAELLARRHVSAALLELTLERSLLDGVFAMGLTPSNRGGEVRPGALPPLLRLDEGVEPGPALREAARRHDAVGRRWGPPADLARLRPVASGAPEAVPSTVHRDLLARADGRRTPRDLAFALGRDVSGVMADLVRLAERGLVETAPRPPGGPLSRRLPERGQDGPGPRPLTQRRPGADGTHLAPGTDTGLPPEVAARLNAAHHVPGDLLGDEE
ncbi:MarR family transcriptional regulator [Nocardiopsis ganjiahuensis]|uniref:MarR family transcriptional regulator n=1 Tax=Nocardiopsis ganjiahuensis TaxID=239984 RepID=UPI000347C542|nr:MarR family transcriptional regulator [Nocardiopsis ganjiahuensis]